MLVKRRVPMTAKAFQFGVRVEHPQQVVNRRAVRAAGRPLRGAAGQRRLRPGGLGKNGTHDLFTFCMCAGGYVIPSVSQEGYFCTNGMSLSKRDSVAANSGLVVTVPVEALRGHRRAGRGAPPGQVREGGVRAGPRRSYAAPAQSARDFLDQPHPDQLRRGPATRGRLSPPTCGRCCRRWWPRRWRTGCRRWTASGAGGSSPRRCYSARSRGAVRRCGSTGTRRRGSRRGCGGCIPVGEGAGFAGGIVSAAVDGLRTARAVMARYAPLAVG